MKPVILFTSLAVLVFITLSDLQSCTDEKNTGTIQKVIEVSTENPLPRNNNEVCHSSRNSGPADPHEKTQITSHIPNPSFSGKMVNYFILIF